MKRLTLFATATLLCGMAAFAQDADELRIYINPGHGAWTSSDRPMKTLREVDGRLTVVEPGTLPSSQANAPDTTAFFETNTNLRKCLAMRDRLESYGLKFDRTLNQDNPNQYRRGAALDMRNNIVMSHVMAGPYPHDPDNGSVCSKNLSVIAREAEENNFDMFISVHSNASSEDGTSTNYICFLYRGTQGEGGDRAPGSRDMCNACWPYAFSIAHQPWTARKKKEDCVLGDVSFYHEEITSMGYSGYLGALRHGVPGFLVEGYFHTYQPSRCRAMNFDADRIEGIQYARGIADYFELEKEATGEIYGVIRDAHQKFQHDIYRPQPNGNDQFLPLNGVTVTLSRDGKVVRTAVTDNHYNGSFVFFDLEPGEYTLAYSHPEYKEADDDQPLTVTVEAATTVYPEVFLENIHYRGDGVDMSDYPNALAGTPAGYIDEFAFSQTYADQTIDILEGKTVRRTLLRGGNLYVLATDADGEPTLAIIDAKTRKLVRELGTDGTEGDDMPLSDIAMTADGVLVGINAGTLTGTGDDIYLYRWENNEDDNLPDGDPETFAELNHAADLASSEFGQSMAFTGTIDDGTVLFTAKSTTTDDVRVEVVTIADGNATGHSHMNLEDAKPLHNAATMGQWQLSIAPDNSANFIITSTGMAPAEFEIGREPGSTPRYIGSLPAGLVEGNAFGASFVNYAGEAVMAAPTGADGKCTGIVLVNVSEGLPYAKAISTKDATLPAADSRMLTANVLVTRDASGRYLSSALNIVGATADGKLSRITTEGAEQPARRANFAYELACAQSGDKATLSFKSTDAAPSATAILTNINDPEDVATFDLGPVAKGLNSFDIETAALTPKASYKWAVEINSDAIGSARMYFASGYNPAKKNNSRGGVVVITDPQLPSFGKVIAAYGFAQGIEVWNPDLTQQGVYHKDAPTMASNGASLFRGAQYNGKAVFCDWSDAGAGYWMFDPESPDALTNIIEGERDSKGAYTVGSQIIGGGATGLSFYDNSLYTFVEDYPTANAGNVLVRYDLGDNAGIAKAPDFVWDAKAAVNTNSLMGSKNADVFVDSHGIWLSQIRAVSQNTISAPSFILIGHDGELKYNSGNYDYVISSCGGGLAVNEAGTILAVSDPANIGISIFSIDWLDDEPLINRLYTIPSAANTYEHTQMRFDPAGNLHVFNRGNGYQMYVLKNSAPKCSTPAPDASVIVVAESGIENILAEDAAATIEYFDLNGRRVDAGNLTPGFYIRRSGRTAEKVIIR